LGSWGARDQLTNGYVLFSVGGSWLRGKSTAAAGYTVLHTGFHTVLAITPYWLLHHTAYWLHHTGYHAVLAITPYCILATPYCILAYGRQAPSALSPVALRLLSPMLSDWAAPHHTTPHQIAPHQTPRTQHNSYSGRAVDASSSVSLCV
jgi:hypothetical protein